MVSARTIARTALIACLMSAGPVMAEGSVSDRHDAWHACLTDAFTLRAALSGRALAAETALRECRESETAYLSALSASPLIDEEDVTRVRPALLVRARTWLLTGKTSRSL
ncbi:hypothetical protein [Methylobacterium haplocladii]|uniref:Lysozyme inhibitor LprI N-terminal domain-containing protein n=1 Tax=Methylobacterium haplocladii TaxID=1176176 RepID=A0A512ILR3_9HYPH|nr:hypothetical protein [Methylobacterium haplocladii]GEO98660.1 hypothetical protein MHA02_10480 [Methylobacterium haplocladii]GJD83939.1 hypothetical protein HPGCJGGD_1813 [Methylobacterium haplocladii]GLS57690.1 hypothetical protein GCM10007887_03460 [Methylobacterium haplocladii]